MVRGDGEQEKMLKNAKTEYWNEHEEIATYLAIEALATKVGDKETAKLARAILREEERMAKFLAGQIKSLTAVVVSEDIPASQRRASKPRTSGTSKATRTGGTRTGGKSKGSAKRSTGGAKRASARSGRKAAPKKSPAKAKRARNPAARSRS
jgi:rubrerythrin